MTSEGITVATNSLLSQFPPPVLYNRTFKDIMHFFKLIATFILVAATGVLASPSFHEENTELNYAGASHGNVDAGNEGATFDSDIQGFSEVPQVEETSLEAAMRRRCYLGRCLSHITFHRRCPRGYHAVAYRHCGFWSIRAVCCRHRRYGRHYLTDSDDTADESSQGSQLEVDGLDEQRDSSTAWRE